MKVIKFWKDFAFDENGKRHIDLTAGGIFCAMFGASSSIIKKAIVRANGICCYSPRFGNYWHERYKELLRETTGFESSAVFSTGSEATEAFWRCMRVYTGKPGIWGGLIDPDLAGTDKPPCDSMHGWTLGALIMAGRLSWPELWIHPDVPQMGQDRIFIPQEATAGMIMEPYHAPSGQFHKMDPTINRIVTRRKEFPDIALCIDEVQGGFGRTGELFAYQHYGNLSPDFVCIGKLAGGGFPVSALLGPKDIMESELVVEKGHLHSTHSGNPIACSVGVAVIEEMVNRKLIERSSELGERMHEALTTFPVRTHGKGLMAGLEFQSKEEADKMVRLCEERGVLVVDTGRKWVKIGPSLVIDEKILINGLLIVKEVVEEVVNARETAPCGSDVKEFTGLIEVLPDVRVQETLPETVSGDLARGEPENSEDGGRKFYDRTCGGELDATSGADPDRGDNGRPVGEGGDESGGGVGV